MSDKLRSSRKLIGEPDIVGFKKTSEMTGSCARNGEDFRLEVNHSMDIPRLTDWCQSPQM